MVRCILFFVLIQLSESFLQHTFLYFSRDVNLGRSNAIAGFPSQLSTRLQVVENSAWANHALLISSFSDGVSNSEDAINFMRNSIVKSMLMKEQRRCEQQVEDSVVVSPCNGPDINAIEAMENIDEALKSSPDDSLNSMLQNIQDPTIRLLYIPTAMYAFRKESTRSPGKQRSRARADGKKRRNQIVHLFNDIFSNAVNVEAVTLDFHDGSIRHPEGSDDKDSFPKDGKEALTTWDPHFIYVEGGNTFWLYHCLTNGDYFQDLVSAITGIQGTAVYCGKSAGAIIAGNAVETGTWKEWDDPTVVPGMESYSDWKNIKGLNLIGGNSIFPHMNNQYQELVDQKKKNLESKVHCLTNSEVCCVRGGEKTLTFITSPLKE